MDTTNASNGDEGANSTIKKEEPLEENMAVKEEPETPLENGEPSLEAVLAFLKKRGLNTTENTLKQELTNPSSDQTSEQGNSQSTNSTSVQSSIVKTEGSSADVSNVLDSYKSEGDPSIYAEAYKDLQRFVETSLDLYRHELALILVRPLDVTFLGKFWESRITPKRFEISRLQKFKILLSVSSVCAYVSRISL